MIRNMLIHGAALATLTLAGWAVPAQASTALYNGNCAPHGNQTRCEVRLHPGSNQNLEVTLRGRLTVPFPRHLAKATVEMWASTCGISGQRMPIIDELTQNGFAIGGVNLGALGWMAGQICLEAYVINCQGPTGAVPCRDMFQSQFSSFTVTTKPR